MTARRFAVLLGAILLLVTACSSNGAGSETTPTALDETETTTTEETADTTTTMAAASDEPVWFFDHLDVGDCWDEVYDASGEPDRTDPPIELACDEPHFHEVYGAWTSSFDEYPGEDGFADEANEQCSAAFVDYIGVEYGEVTGVDSFAPRPTENEWDAGARRLVCVAYFDEGRVGASFQGNGATEPLPYDLPDSTPLPDGAEIFAISDGDDGLRLAGYGVSMPQTEALTQILDRAARAGWSIDAQNAASNSIVLEMSFEGSDYTFVISATNEDDPEDLTLAVYYPPGPLPSYEDR